MKPLYSTTLIRLVGVFGITVALVVAIATGAALLAGRQEAVTSARDITASLARPLTEAVARSFNSIDVTLASVADLARESGLAGDAIDLVRPVAQRLVFTPHLRQVLVVAADGRVLFDSANILTGGRLDVAATLEDHRRMPRPLVIGIPVAGRYIGGEAKAAGQSLIPVSRAILHSDGAIAALVVAAVNPEHFHGSFDALRMQSGVRVQLWRFDGILLASSDGGGVSPGFIPADAALFKSHLKASEMGTFIDDDHDGVRRITSYRTTLSWPLVISVGLPMDRALANWRANVANVGWPVGLVTLVVLGFTVLLMRTLARRARDEATLRLSDRVLANVSNGVTIADAQSGDLPLLYVNPAFERITGYSAGEALGRNARFLHADEADQEGLDAIRVALAEGSAVTVKLRNTRADGGRFWNQVSLTPVRNPAGTITHWVGVQRDITNEEESRAALAAAYDDVARYSADLERFSFVLAHHLQEPARQMRLQAQILQQQTGNGGRGDGGSGPASLIIDASARLIELLRDVQAYLAVERHAPKGAVGSAQQALESAVRRLEAQEDGWLEAVPLPHVALPQKQLDDLFEIILENAIRFRHPGRGLRVRISVVFDEGKWRFRIADNGIGVESCYFERIFVPLERLHHDTERSGGTGIGLAIARKTVEAAGGRIWVESDGASGSTFVFTLPGA
ncbi:Signal transduction histidine kinase [Magnetospirillum sp. SS-4]|nr:Signal transduction histidine kinase [Magnetospirillum sp. SS-4]